MRLLIVLSVVVLMSSVIALSSPAAGTHGCTQPIPTPVAGSPPPAPAKQGIVLLNEVLLNPHSTWNCSESGTYFVSKDTWVELYNPQNSPFNLYTAHTYLDSGPNTVIFYMPFGAAIAAHGFLVVFPRTVPNFAPTNTPTLRLMIGNVTVDEVKVPAPGPDQSYARITDGNSKWQVTSTPTIDASNNTNNATPTAGSSSGSQGQGYSNGTPSPLASGTQPVWAKLHLPTPTSTASDNASSTPQQPPAQPATVGGADVTRRIALTVIAALLAATLLGCWWLFRRS